jgi:[NiFe] hydrogenase assembly HybE family chaperone
MNDVARRLETAFEDIARTRMAGLPFVNPALKVEAVGFSECEGQWMGVLVTPWSINVVLLPGSGPWPALRAGSERFVDLPAGRFRFIAAHDEALGEYHACSLFSPALEFADHETARATAVAALDALRDPATSAEPQRPAEPLSRREFLRGCRPEPGHADRG